MKQPSDRKNSGFTLLEVIITITIIGLLAAIAVPNMIIARSKAQTNGCINNLKHIDAAIQQWALEENKGIGAPVSAADLTPYLGRGGSLASVFCPVDNSKRFANSYTLLNTVTRPVCIKIPGTHLLD